MSRSDWKGVTWPKVVKGRCSKHHTRVGAFTGLCFECHREQLAHAKAAN